MNTQDGLPIRTGVAIAAGCLIAGTIDTGAAALINRMPIPWILHAIAGGVTGMAALRGGTATAWIGLRLQWGMSLLIAAIFSTAALRLRWMLRRPVAAGLAYGAIVFVVMNYVVMPLSAWHRINRFPPEKFIENLAAMLLSGLIVAIGAKYCMRERAALPVSSKTSP
ncbi:MAG: hypothetical protein ACREPL_02745 [Rhodanobacteraceae bacterium]